MVTTDIDAGERQGANWVTQNIFVVGLDETNRATLRTLPDAQQLTFRQLLTRSELQHGTVSIPEVLDKAQRELDDFPGSIDAIVGYWDFPIPMMVPILCARYGLPSADLAAVVKCEHKYWSRLEQQRVIEEVPGFGLLDLDDEPAALPSGVSYPAWIKPIKSASSEGAHYLENDDDLRAAVAIERHEVGRIGGPFNDILAMLDLPPEIATISGTACLVEQAAAGEQVTVEGFSRNGQVRVYGVVDSITHPDAPSFVRYQYPSRLPEHVLEHMAEVSRRVITAFGLTNTTFNIEYFWDAQAERLRLLEINARHSQSHARLFQLVDGLPNHACMIDLALNRDPHIPSRQGPYAVAGTWFMRQFADGVVHRVPTPSEVLQIEQDIPGTTIHLDVEPADRLSDRQGEDSFTYTLGTVYIGARDEEELVRKYARVVEALDFEISEQQEGA